MRVRVAVFLERDIEELLFLVVAINTSNLVFLFKYEKLTCSLNNLLPTFDRSMNNSTYFLKS